MSGDVSVRSNRIDELTWAEYSERIVGEVVIVPLGATEQHGLALPLGTDTMHTIPVAELVAAAYPALIAPPLHYGYKSHPTVGGGEVFPGTISLDAVTYIGIIKNIVMQLAADGCSRIVMLNGHLENAMMIHEGIDLALRELRDDDVQVMNVSWVDMIARSTILDFYPGPFPGMEIEHASFLEASMVLHARPELVKLERAGTETATFPDYILHPQPAGVIPANGSFTRSHGARGEYGRTMIEEAAGRLVAVLTERWG